MGLRTVGIWALLPFFFAALAVFFMLDLDGIEKERLQLERDAAEGEGNVVASAEMVEVGGSS